MSDGEMIEEYENDKPFPSCLMFGLNEKKQPLHVVTAMDTNENWCYIVTVYRPDLRHFNKDFKTRKK